MENLARICLKTKNENWIGNGVRCEGPGSNLYRMYVWYILGLGEHRTNFIATKNTHLSGPSQPSILSCCVSPILSTPPRTLIFFFFLPLLKFFLLFTVITLSVPFIGGCSVLQTATNSFCWFIQNPSLFRKPCQSWP